jgi:uncharacterized HAD superfamily protein
MIFVFDLDDTVIDTDGYSEKYIKNFFEKHNLPYKQIFNVARFAEKKFDWDNETALEWYKTYGDQMMLEFPFNKDAKEVINSLYDLGNTIIIATARANDWHVDPEGITKKWLEQNELKYHKLYIGRIDKEKICEETNADFFLDDDLKITARVGTYFNARGRGISCLFNTAYNQNLEEDVNVVRVKSFKEFFKLTVGEDFIK